MAILGFALTQALYFKPNRVISYVTALFSSYYEGISVQDALVPPGAEAVCNNRAQVFSSVGIQKVRPCLYRQTEDCKYKKISLLQMATRSASRPYNEENWQGNCL
jgi:hypothetical protein